MVIVIEAGSTRAAIAHELRRQLIFVPKGEVKNEFTI
jgi:hypothetical protein